MLKWLCLVFIFSLIQVSSPAFGNAETALNVFKALEGTWEIQVEGKPIPTKMTYDLGSRNSIVREQFGKELSVFYRDGADLLMTHFCNIGNQPRLKLKENTVDGIFEFELFDITGLSNPNAPHVKKIIYKFLDEKRFDLELVWQRGNTEESEKYSLHKN